jgi:hypothetical protein
VPLVVGQSLFAQVLVATSHGADLLLLGAELELEQGSQLQVKCLVCELVGCAVASCAHVAHHHEDKCKALPAAVPALTMACVVH